MSPHWLKLLERLGAPLERTGELEDPFAPGRIRQGAWHEFRHHEILFQLYGPPADSPWYPFHCPTLFAAIERLKLMPRLTELAPELSSDRPDGAWGWLDRETAVVVDLRGGLSVQLGASLAIEAGAQLISTFDHWPQPNPLKPFAESSYVNMAPLPWPPEQVDNRVAIDSRDVIDSMISLAPEVYQRRRLGLAADAPPVWLCDARRMRAVKPGPGHFDNRYYIDDSLLPTPEQLLRAGIRRVVLFADEADSPVSDDLSVFLAASHRAGLILRRAALADLDSWVRLLPMEPPLPVQQSGLFYPKSQVGGFGRRVPVPSESSGGSFGGGG